MLRPGYAVVFLVLCEHWSVSELILDSISARTPGSSSTDGVLLSGAIEASPVVIATAGTQEYRKVCRGSSSGLAHVGEASERYKMYRTLYSNCTYVDGNLELVFLGEPAGEGQPGKGQAGEGQPGKGQSGEEPAGEEPYDLRFLQDIREITGYVLIVANYADYIPLLSLRVIRGQTLFEHEGKYYSLFVALNYKPQSEVGLKELQLTSLHEILAGSVFFFDNDLLCYEDTVNWMDIMDGEGAEVVMLHSERHYKRQCAKCHESCEFRGNRHCWGEGPENCQKVTRLSCSPQCQGRCFGSLPDQCCHLECAGGCTGTTQSDCWSCRNFENEGTCENSCPSEFAYSPRVNRPVRNPRAKYAYGSLCVDKCPAHLMADKGACVKDCGAGRTGDKEGRCVECKGLCPKSCRIRTEDGEFIHSGNIGQYNGCTIIQGSIRILDASFSGDEYNGIGPMKNSQLSVLETIREVSDFVQIQANDKGFRNLGVLRNLRVIHGRRLGRGGISLQIFKSSLEILGFESLKEVKRGTIYVANNSRLCFAGDVDWDGIRESEEQRVMVENNRDSTSCAEDNGVCDAECSYDGCWGALDDQCVSCRHFRFDGRCIRNCESLPGIYLWSRSRSKECRRCHLECHDNCTGPGNEDCGRCRNVRNGPNCVPKCPNSKYTDGSGICQPCHSNCKGGCTGPKHTVGPGGCSSCGLVVFHENRRTVMKCLPLEAGCQEGFYLQVLPRTHLRQGVLTGKQGCLKCHSECQTCSAFGRSFCTSCRHFFQGDKCVPECASDYYFLPGEGRCLPCDPQCLKCNGASADNCSVCRLYKVYKDFENREINPLFNCTEKCPDFALHKMTIDTRGIMGTVCVAEDNLKRSHSCLIGAVVYVAVAFVALALVGVVVLRRRRAQAEATEVKLTEQVSGMVSGGMVSGGVVSGSDDAEGLWIPDVIKSEEFSKMGPDPHGYLSNEFCWV